MAAEPVKKAAKISNREKADTGRKRTIPCSCGGTMEWCKVGGTMKYVCTTCSLVNEA
jgi:hypothetical protein